MYRIEKDFTFSAAHHLAGLPDDHPCSRVHGHNYTVRVRLVADKLNHVGFVQDYRELNWIKNWIDEVLDHQDLNETWPAMNPTAENIARLIFDTWIEKYPKLAAVGVSETLKTWAWYE